MERVQRQFRVQVALTALAVSLSLIPVSRQMSLFLFPVVMMQMELRHYLLPRRARLSEGATVGWGADVGPDRRSLSRLSLGYAALYMLVIGVQGGRVTPYAWVLAAAGAVLLWWLERRWLNAPGTEDCTAR